MIEYAQLAERWGPGNLLHFPLERFVDHLGFGPDRLPPEGGMPAEVPIVFTAYLEGEVSLFNVIELQVGDGPPMGLIALGATPDDHKLLYCLDGDSGAVLLVDLETPTLELVNSSFANFVEFLYHLDGLIQADSGDKSARANSASRLRENLSSIDPTAFGDSESWWSIAFAQLEGRA